MNSRLIEYIKNNKVTEKRLITEISDEREKKLPTRSAYVLLKKYAREFFRQGKQPRMIALSGLRGVGKTTLMWQTANYVYQNHTTKIFFISADDLDILGTSLYEAIDVLEKHILKGSLNELDEKILLMIDEVHEAKDWQKTLKILYEKGKKLFVLTTGSSALLLHSNADLASRWTLMKIYPFSFPEFVLAKSWINNSPEKLFPVPGLAGKLREILFYSSDYQNLKKALSLEQAKITEYLSKAKKLLAEDINALIDEYISYHNIARFLPITNKTLIIERLLDLFERILLKDIPQIAPEQVGVCYRILLRIALSDEINFQTLAKEFRIKENEAEKIVNTLHRAEILNIFSPYGSLRTRSGENKKAFFMSPSLRRALYARIYGNKINNTLRAKLYEDILAMYLRRNLFEGLVSFGYGKKKNPDFIIETRESPVLMEIGISKVSSKQIESFPAYRYGIIINSKLSDIAYKDKSRILFLPLSWALLM